MNNECFGLEAFHFQLGQSAQCPCREFWALLCRWGDELRSCWRPLPWVRAEQGSRGPGCPAPLQCCVSPRGLPACAAGWERAPADPDGHGTSLLSSDPFCGSWPYLDFCPFWTCKKACTGQRLWLLQGGSCSGPSRLLWILLWYLETRGKSVQNWGWGKAFQRGSHSGSTHCDWAAHRRVHLGNF